MNKDIQTTITNLRKLATYIEEKVPQQALNMAEFRSNEFGDSVEFEDIHNCGTAGCALGHAPFVKGMEVVDEERIQTGILPPLLDWSKYMGRVFPMPEHSRTWECDLWSSCFEASLSSDKASVIGRLRDFAQRLEIRYEEV